MLLECFLDLIKVSYIFKKIIQILIKSDIVRQNLVLIGHFVHAENDRSFENQCPRFSPIGTPLQNVCHCSLKKNVKYGHEKKTVFCNNFGPVLPYFRANSLYKFPESRADVTEFSVPNCPKQGSYRPPPPPASYAYVQE